MNHSILCQMRMPLVLLLIAATFRLTSYAGTWVDLCNDPENKDSELTGIGHEIMLTRQVKLTSRLKVGTYILPLVSSFPIVVGSHKLAFYLLDVLRLVLRYANHDHLNRC